jgi:ankyrin repeat protein
MVQCFVELGADVDKRETDGTTALIAASKMGRFHIVRHLVELGASVEAADKYGDTALLRSAHATVTILRCMFCWSTRMQTLNV